jgi:putative nucleotidyltransferase with HDIG domain
MSMNDVRNMLEAGFPGLHARIEETLIEAEARYNRQANQAPSEFLLDHTRRTAAIAHKIASIEGVDSFLPILVALYHDAGKFHDGEYHKDDVPEEEHAAVLAGQMLAEFGVARSDIEAVREALRALYDDRLPCLGPSRIVQDADRLDKLGALGVGAFFTKAALRGRGLIDALVHTLSRELTYAVAAPRSMFTETGKTLAREQAAKTIAFFDDLLDDLESWGIASFERRIIVLEENFRTRDSASVHGMEATIVMPRACPDCEAALELTHRRGRGVKCEKLTARFACGCCGYAQETSFCLPVLASSDAVPPYRKGVNAQAGRRQQIKKTRQKAAVLP